MKVKPRKLKVSGFPSPRVARRSAAKRPNSIRRVLSGLSDSENSSNRLRISSQKRRASASCSKPTTSRVARGNLTSRRSRNRTCASPLIRLLSSSRYAAKHRPMREERRSAQRGSADPVLRPTAVSLEALVFSHRPTREASVQIAQRRVKCRLIVTAIFDTNLLVPTTLHDTRYASSVISVALVDLHLQNRLR